MKNCFFFRGLLLVWLLGIASADAAESADKNTRYFHLAGRDFTRSEAEFIAGKHSDLVSAVQANYAAAAAIVLCDRAGIKLSAEHTRQTLERSLLLMLPEAKSKFLESLKSGNLTLEQWLDREKLHFANQLTDALRRWYIKLHGESSPIRSEHIQSWYFRNMDIFRRIKLDMSQVWGFAPGDRSGLRQACGALQQGMPAAAVRQKYALNVNEDAVLEDLHRSKFQRKKLGSDFWEVAGDKYLLLIRRSGLSCTYLPLDDTLQQAVGNALYDALAKAYLAEVMKKEFADKEIKFY